MTDDLRARIEGAIGHGLWFAQADPDSVHPEATKAVLAVVQPILADRDRLAEELEENIRAMNVLRRQRDEASTERDTLRLELRDAEAQRDPLVVNEMTGSYLIGRQVASAGLYNTVLRRAMKAEAERDGRREVERTQAESAVGRVRDWLGEWGPQLPDGVREAVGRALDGPADRSTAAAIDETYRYEPPNCQCGHGAERHGPEAGCIECHCPSALARPCEHRDPKWLGHRPGDLSVWCACGAQVFAGPRTTPNNPSASNEAANNPTGEA